MMTRGGGGVPGFRQLVSVQATYQIRITPEGVLTCDDVIKVPLSYAVNRQTVIDRGAYSIIPVVELTIPLQFLVFEIITNEGVTVEPLSTLIPPDVSNPYNDVRSYFVLPSGTTGIKGVVFKPKSASMRAALQFGVLPPPYNYDNALFGVTAHKLDELETSVEENTFNINELNQAVYSLRNENANVTLNRAQDAPNYLDVPSLNTKSSLLGWYLELETGSTLKVEFKVGTDSEIVIDETDITAYNLIFVTFDRLSGVVSLYGGHYSGATTKATSQKLLSSGVIMPWGDTGGKIVITKDGIDTGNNIRKGFVTLVKLR